MGLGQIKTRRQSAVEAPSMFNINMYDRIKRRKQNTAKVNVENSSITKDILVKPNNCDRKSFGFSLKKVYILVSKIKLSEKLMKHKKSTLTKRKKRKVNLKSHRKLNLNSSNIETYKRKQQSSIRLKLHPKTVKDYQNNDKILASFNSGHSDDMFENSKAPSRVSQMNLDDSISDVEPSSDVKSKTPVINYVSRFYGCLRMEEEEASETPGQFKRCAFLRNAIREKKSKKLFPKCSVAKSSTHGFNSCPSELKPTLEETDGDLLSDSEDEEMEPYFEDA